MPIHYFRDQAKKHCHECGVPLRGHGSLSQDEVAGIEQLSETHSRLRPKRVGRKVELVLLPEQLGVQVGRVTDYLQNGTKP